MLLISFICLQTVQTKVKECTLPLESPTMSPVSPAHVRLVIAPQPREMRWCSLLQKGMREVDGVRRG